MGDTKPAHVVIVEMIRESIVCLTADGDVDAEEISVILLQMGGLAFELLMLKRMVIPEKHRSEVVQALRQIKTEFSSRENIEKLLPEVVLQDLES